VRDLVGIPPAKEPIQDHGQQGEKRYELDE
jgi:hypothetical protein